MVGADNIITSARLVFGGMAATPKRASGAEAALVGKAWSESAIETACTALREDFTPLTDMRATAAYRMLVAQNLLLRFYLEHSEIPGEYRLQREAAE
jgi:xanthine dehydrogenase small subunit